MENTLIKRTCINLKKKKTPPISYLLLYISAEKSEAPDLGLVISHQNPLIRLGFYYHHIEVEHLLSSNAESLFLETRI